MRRILSLLLVFVLVLSMGTTALATEGIEGGEQPHEEEQQTTVTVGTLDELIAAIDAAEDGDTIAISATIKFDGRNLVSDKDITLVRAENFSSSFFRFNNKAGQISGITIYDDMESIGAVSIENTDSADCKVTFSDCNFVGENNSFSFIVNIFSGKVEFTDCSFESNKDTALNIGLDSTVIVDGCTFTDNTTIMQGAAIKNAGSLELKNTVIKNNQAGIGGGVYNTGTLSITNCQFADNTSTDDKSADIYSSGTLTITDSQTDGAGFYEESTGEKVTLPLTDYTSTAKMIYLTDADAAVYFAPDEPEEPEEEEPSPDDEPQNPEETPTTPSEQPNEGGNENTPNGQEQPSEQPTSPDNGNDTNTPGDTQQPTTKPDGGEQDEADDNNNEPEIIYRPVYIRVPVYIEREPEPEEDPAPTFVCGDAVIDTSRSVVLEGYDDGLLHLEDSLSRAQFATILYRLLDEETIERYDSADTVFNDVAPDAWYCRTVTTIANAGIMCGTGNGNYDPDAPLTWAHIITVMSRFVEPENCEVQNIQYDGWATNAVETAVALGWIADHASFNPNAAISRGELAYFVNIVLAMYR